MFSIHTIFGSLRRNIDYAIYQPYLADILKIQETRQQQSFKHFEYVKHSENQNIK